AELECRQRSALIAWPSLIDPHMNGNAGVVRLIDRRGCGAPVHAGKPAGIAVREHVHRLARLFSRSDFLDERKPMDADEAAGLGVLVGKLGGTLVSGLDAQFARKIANGLPHFLERPAEIDSRGPLL